MKGKLLTLLIAFPLLVGCSCNPQPEHKGRKVYVDYVECDIKKVELEVGESKTVTATVYPENATNKNFHWSMDNSAIATVDNKGKITGVAKGQTRAKVVTEDENKKDYVQVYVYDSTSVRGVELNYSSKDMNVGDTLSLLATVTPNTATNKTVSWTSSNGTVASVSNSGLVTALGSGYTNITATTNEGNYTAVCVIHVTGSESTELWDKSQDSLRTGTKTLDFYNFNDFHGSTSESDDGKEPGINLLSSYVKSLKQNNNDGFVLTSSGDMWQGSADSNITRGRLVVDWMNMLNFSAMALGNHEFDWTVEQIKTNQAFSHFDMLACNIIETTTNKNVDWVKPYTTITRNGVHIGIIGAIGEGITSSIVASNVKNLQFADPNPYIVSWSQYLKGEGADVILVLLHGSVGSIDSSTTPYVDGVFGGHTHKPEKETLNSVPMIQAYKNGMAIGKIEMNYSFTSKSVTNAVGNVIDLSASFIRSLGLSEDTETQNMYQKHLDEEISEIKNEVVTTYTGGISYNDLPYVYGAYAYRYFNETHQSEENVQAQYVFSNQARSAIPASSKGITYGDIYKSLPFDNYLVLCAIKGTYIKRYYGPNNYYCWHPSYGELDSNEFDTYCNGLNDNQTYYVLTINYLSEKYDGGSLNVVSNYMEEDAMPRNIVKRYLSGYPSNCLL